MRHLVLAVLILILGALAWLVGQGCGTANGAPMAPQSNFTYLQKIRDGVVFSEGFENDNFVSAEGWTVLQGVPGNSTIQYKDGIKSWDNSANAQSLPVVSKSFNVQSSMIIVWFYDDVSHTTEQGPYVKVKMSDGTYMSVGVRNGITSTNYSYGAQGAGTDAPTTDSGIARTTGWHQFVFQAFVAPAGPSPFTCIQIDTNQVYANTPASNPLYLSAVYVQANTVGGTGNSFGFFDELAAFVYSVDFFNGVRNLPDLIQVINASGLKANIYDINNSLLYSSTENNSILYLPVYYSTAFYPNTGHDFPFSGYIEISDPTGKNTACRSQLLNLNPGDIYDFQKLKFGQKFKPYDPQNAALTNVNQSTAGVTETIFNAFKNKYVFGIPILEGIDYKKQYDEWYNYAVQGLPFSAQVEDNNIGFGVIDSNPSVGTSVIQIKPNLSTNPTDAFTVGRKYVLFNAANTRRQTMTLLAKNDPCLTMTENFEYPFANLDYIADITFHPFLELGNHPYGLSAQDERYVRYKMNQIVQDWNGG